MRKPTVLNEKWWLVDGPVVYRGAVNIGGVAYRADSPGEAQLIAARLNNYERGVSKWRWRALKEAARNARLTDRLMSLIANTEEGK